MTRPPPLQPLPLPYVEPGTTPPRGNRGWIGWLIFGSLAVLLFFFMALKQQTPTLQTIPLSDFSDQLERGNVQQVVVESDALTGRMIRPGKIGVQMVSNFRTDLPTGAGQSWDFMQWLLANRRGATVVAGHNVVSNVILPFIPWVFIFLFAWYFIFQRLRGRAAPREPLRVVLVNPEPRA